MPAFGAEAPLYLYGIPAEQRGSRCILESDTCIVSLRGETPCDGVV